MEQGKYATVINCMDGRVQEPMIQWMKKNYNVDYIDMITEPGPDKCLLDAGPEIIENIKKRILISVEKHGSKILILAAHADCYGNPVSREKHIELIKKGIDVLKTWNLEVDIQGVWINEQWKVEPIT